MTVERATFCLYQTSTEPATNLQLQYLQRQHSTIVFYLRHICIWNDTVAELWPASGREEKIRVPHVRWHRVEPRRGFTCLLDFNMLMASRSWTGSVIEIQQSEKCSALTKWLLRCRLWLTLHWMQPFKSAPACGEPLNRLK